MNQVAIQSNGTIQPHFNSKQIEILKNSMCKGVSDEEFEVFMMACAKTQLDPFMKQIYAIPRKFKKPDGTWGQSITIQTSIDGYRLIAERTERYAPGPEPTYNYDKEGNLISATSYIKKLTKDGTWHTVSASAYLDEYMQTFADRQTGEKKPTGLWVNMPKTMLAKCAEAQALRKAFPAEMSGIYTKEEMEQADVVVVPEKTFVEMGHEKAASLIIAFNKCPKEYQDLINESFKKQYDTIDFHKLPAHIYDRFMNSLQQNMKKDPEFVALPLGEEI